MRVEVCAACFVQRAIALLHGGDSQTGHQRQNHCGNCGGAQDTFAIGRTLALQLRVRHIGLDPLVVEDAMIDAIANG